MPRTCSNCRKTKKSIEFTVDKRSKSGFTNLCKKCNNRERSVLVECQQCGKNVSKRSKAVHMRSAKCLAGPQPWDQFKSTGDNIVKCPCGHKNCTIKISEKNCYRHLKYGFRIPLPKISVQ